MDSLSGLRHVVESATRCHMNKVTGKIEKMTRHCASRGRARAAAMPTREGQRGGLRAQPWLHGVSRLERLTAQPLLASERSLF